MNRQHRGTLRKITAVAAVTALASVALLWSLNTLAPLFGGPTFQFRHVIAILIALVVLRMGVGRRIVHRDRSASAPEIH